MRLGNKTWKWKTIGYPLSLYPRKDSDYPTNVSYSQINLLTDARALTWRFPPNIKPKEADLLAQRFRDNGFNMVFTEGYRYLFTKKNDPPTWWNSRIPRSFEENCRALRIFCEACHKYKLKVIAHLTAYAVHESYYRNHPEQAMVRIKTGKKLHYRRYGTWMMCPNNPEFKQAFLVRLMKLLRFTKVDGVMLDETQFFFHDSCGCVFCKEAFKQKFGYELPDYSNHSVWNNYSSDVWRKWLKFRIMTNEEFHRQVKEVTIEECGRNAVYTGVYCEAINPEISRVEGTDLESFSGVMNINFFECEPPNPWSWKYNVAEAKYYLAYGPSFFLSYSRTPSQQFFGWIFGLSAGLRPWLWPQCYKIPPMPLLWEQKWALLISASECFCNIGIASPLNLQTRFDCDVRRQKMAVKEYIGWAEVLTEEHIPFDTIALSNINTSAKLKKYRVLILPDILSIPREKFCLLKEYINSGGYLIAVGESCSFNSLGINKKSKAGQILTEKRNDKHYERSSGVILTFRPGTACYVPKIGKYRIGENGFWIDRRDPVMKNLILKTIKTGLQPVDSYLTTENIPEGIFINPMYLNTPHYKGLVIHVLNCLGARFDNTIAVSPRRREYEFINYPSPYTVIQSNSQMILRVKAANISAAYMISPDFNPVVRLKWKYDSGNYCKIIIPDIPRYCFLYLVQGNKDFISDMKYAVTEEMPPLSPFPLFFEDMTPNERNTTLLPILKLTGLLNKSTKNKIVRKLDSVSQVSISPYQTKPSANPNPETRLLEFPWNRINYMHYLQFIENYSYKLSKNSKPANCICLYGDLSKASKAWIKFKVDESIPELFASRLILRITGLDDDAPSYCKIRIKCNSNIIYKGESKFSSSFWDVHEFEIPLEILKKGNNSITIENIAHTIYIGRPPWFIIRKIELLKR